MSEYIRAKLKGGEYFFTIVTFNRMSFLTSQLARGILRIAWKQVQKKYSFEVRAVGLLPDHLHCIWRLPEDDNDFSTRWMILKAIFTKKFLAAGGLEGKRNAPKTK